MNEAQPGILFLIDTLDERGGTELFLYRLVVHLAQKYLPIVCPLQPRDSVMIRLLREQGIEVIPLDLQTILSVTAIKQALCLRRVIKEKNIRIVQTMHWGSDVYGALCKRWWRNPHLLSSRRDLGFTETKRRHYWLRRASNPLFDRIVVNSSAMGAQLAEKEKIPLQRMATIHNGVELASPLSADRSQALRRSLGLALDDFVIGCVANIQPVKGIEYLLEAMGAVAAKKENIKLLLVGGDGIDRSFLKEYYAKLDQLISEHHLEHKVAFLGLRDDVPDLLAIMNVMALPSLSEGFSNAILEAMAAGIPVVATKVGGNSEAVLDGETGFLVPAADSSALAKALQDLIHDITLAERMGKNGRRLVEKQFSVERMVNAWDQLYAELLDAQEPTPGQRVKPGLRS